MAHDHHSNRVVQKKVGTRNTHPGVDFFAYFFGVIGPLMTLPQAYLIWSTQDASNVSIFSFVAFFAMAIAWFIYGIVHKEKLMIISNIIWILGHGAIVLGIILF